MAELLVQAKKHWMDDMTQEQIDALDEGKKKSRNARIEIGDIVVVRPDGWNWGKEERLPNYIVVKIPELSIEEAGKYENPLFSEPDENGISHILKKRKWQVPGIEEHINAKKDSIRLAKDLKFKEKING
jgi:hypothetical protein